MAKIDRVKLARGTKLLDDHVHGSIGNNTGLQAAANQINNNAVQIDQTDAKEGIFRLNWHLPYLGADGPWSAGMPFCIPFCLPPFREFFSQATDTHGDKQFTMSSNAPHVFLDEISFGFDQRAEPATIISHYSSSEATGRQTGTAKGSLYYGEYNAYDMEFSLVEKSQKYFGNDDPYNSIERTLFSVPVKGSVLFSGETFRRNPLLLQDVSQAMHPYKTYALVIAAPNMMKDSSSFDTGMTWDRTLVSVQISLKFRTTLVQRDIQANANTVGQNIQNMPTADSNLTPRSRTAIGQTIAITDPAAGAVIEADTAAGINANTAIVDKVFRDKLKGGWNKFGGTAPRQELFHDGCYDVIAVPIMNNRCGGVVSNNMMEEPWSNNTAAAADQELCDRRYVPLVHPFTVHHVILAWNWQNFVRPQQGTTGKVTPAMLPQSVSGGTPRYTFKVEVGVGMLAGFRGDYHTYENVAYHSMTGPTSGSGTNYEPQATWDSCLIDRINAGSFTVPREPTGTTPTQAPWDWELHQVPICARANPANSVSTSNYYYISGQPVYVGKNWSLNQGRSLLSDSGGTYNATATGNTQGQEQMLEVRMKLSDTYGLSNQNAELQSGYMGHWVYILGKKTLV
jgi:hypothetical protein